MAAAGTDSMPARLPASHRRRQLLDVAAVAFADRGFHGTSMEAVADAAGVTKPVVYRHFKSKRRLYVELLEDVGGQLLGVIAKATAGAGTPREQVEAGFTAYFAFMVDHTSAFRLLFGGGARRDPEFADALRPVELAVAETVAGLIDADIDADHRRVLAHALIGMAEGVSRHWMAGQSQLRPDMLARQIADFAYAGLRGVHRV